MAASIFMPKDAPELAASPPDAQGWLNAYLGEGAWSGRAGPLAEARQAHCLSKGKRILLMFGKDVAVLPENESALPLWQAGASSLLTAAENGGRLVTTMVCLAMTRG